LDDYTSDGKHQDVRQKKKSKAKLEKEVLAIDARVMFDWNDFPEVPSGGN
jgi:hypothetical protein